MISAKVSALVAAAFVLAGAACSSSIPVPPPDCSADPFACPAGQTCWVTDTAGNYACQPSGSGALGAACRNTPGGPTCTDGLDCFEATAAGGTCVAYCDPTNAAHGCASGTSCQAGQVVGTSEAIHLCMGPPGLDGGLEGGSDGGDE